MDVISVNCQLGRGMRDQFALIVDAAYRLAHSPLETVSVAPDEERLVRLRVPPGRRRDLTRRHGEGDFAAKEDGFDVKAQRTALVECEVEPRLKAGSLLLVTVTLMRYFPRTD